MNRHIKYILDQANLIAQAENIKYVREKQILSAIIVSGSLSAANHLDQVYDILIPFEKAQATKLDNETKLDIEPSLKKAIEKRMENQLIINSASLIDIIVARKGEDFLYRHTVGYSKEAYFEALYLESGESIYAITQKIIEEIVSFNNKNEGKDGVQLSRFRTELDSEKFRSFIENFNVKAAMGDYDALYDYNNLSDEIFATLSRKNKPNPLLIGKAGVGKSSFVELISKKIVENDCSPQMKDKIIYCLDISGLVSGTKYRGQMEEKILSVLKIAKADKRIVLFIDEIHTLIKAGSSEESDLSIGNILKPVLARGEIRCIGATTTHEYNNSIKRDTALSRRFRNIRVSEPLLSETKIILENVLVVYEDHFKCVYSDDFIDTAIEMSNEKYPNRNFPDKAFDVVDSTSAYFSLKGISEITGDHIKQFFSMNKNKFLSMGKDKRVQDCFTKHLDSTVVADIQNEIKEGRETNFLKRIEISFPTSKIGVKLKGVRDAINNCGMECFSVDAANLKPESISGLFALAEDSDNGVLLIKGDIKSDPTLSKIVDEGEICLPNGAISSFSEVILLNVTEEKESKKGFGFSRATN